jgi:hypothetical protein
MSMHITPQEGSSSSKKKDLAFKLAMRREAKKISLMIAQVMMKLMMQV